MDQRSLCFTDGLFDGMKLLGEIETGSSLIEHFDDAAKVAFGALQALDDFRVGFVHMILGHVAHVSPRGGYGKSGIVTLEAGTEPPGILASRLDRRGRTAFGDDT